MEHLVDDNAVQIDDEVVKKYAMETLGLKDQSTIDGAVAHAKSQAAKVTESKLQAEIDALKQQVTAAADKPSKTEGESEVMKAMRLQNEQMQQQLQAMQDNIAAQQEAAKRARLEANLAQSIAGKFIDDESAMLLINSKHVKQDENGEFYFINSDNAMVDIDGLVQHLMQTKPHMVKSNAVSGVGGKASTAIKAQYKNVNELLDDYDKFQAAGKLDELNEIKNKLIREKAGASANPNRGVAALGF